MPFCGIFSVGIPIALNMVLIPSLIFFLFAKKSTFVISHSRILVNLKDLHVIVFYFKVASGSALIIQTTYFLWQLIYDKNTVVFTQDFNNNMNLVIIGMAMLIILDKIIALIAATVYNKVESSL